MKEDKKAASLEAVDKVRITVLVDNFIDATLKSSPGVSRFRDREIDELLAEHGLSLFLEIIKGGETSSFLLDTGASASPVSFNAQNLGIDLKKLKGIFLSHNHGDHTGGLEKVLSITGPIPVFVHPNGDPAR